VVQDEGNVTLERIISADDHMDIWAIPPTLFAERLPAGLRERAPRVVEGERGPVWVDGERELGPNGRPDARLPSLFGRAGMSDAGNRPGTPALRLEDMDRDGIYAEVIYGPVRGFPMQDPALELACLQVYNDWGAEFNSHSPERLHLLPILPYTGPEAATAELRRVAALGHRGAIFDHWRSLPPVFQPAWEPFWQAADEMGLPISFHIGGGLTSLKGVRGSWEQAAFSTLTPMQLDEVLVGMTFSGMLDRHPNVRIVLAESGIGWVPYLVERMDLRRKSYAKSIHDYLIRRMPSEIFRDQVFLSFEEDQLGVELIPRLGAGNVMWASDYPHPASTFPNSRQAIAEQFAGLGEDVKRQVCCDNAARLYGIA
jgi:predicted TIM-barrel fold metal-dependent hydrolase